MDHLTEIKRIIAGIERASYQRGWDDAVAHILAAAKNPASARRSLVQEISLFPPTLSPPKSGNKRTASEMVMEAIAAHPGNRGSEIVRFVFSQTPDADRKALERTCRTALMRLKKKHLIENRDGLWYPKEASQK